LRFVQDSPLFFKLEPNIADQIHHAICFRACTWNRGTDLHIGLETKRQQSMDAAHNLNIFDFQSLAVLGFCGIREGQQNTLRTFENPSLSTIEEV